MTTRTAFCRNDCYDRDQASDGVSRYGAYLAQKHSMFLDYDQEPTSSRWEFAAAAWQIAQSPIMSPGYVTPHPRVQSADVTWDDEGHLAITVTIVLPDLPQGTQMPRARGWSYDSISDRWYDPQDSSRLTALCLMKVRVPVPADVLPDPDYQGGIPRTITAIDAITAVCHLLNRELAALLEHS
jgi:hypothetical protein